jgi:DNA-binding beta-propeller fold protein YncE
LFQDIYLTGTNFISTNHVFVNGTPIAATAVADISSSVIRARIPATLIAVPPPSGLLTVTVSRQSGTPQNCAPDVTQCQIVVTSVRPAVVGPSPDSISQSTAGVLSFNVNGGFFGTAANPSVSATYDGQLRGAAIDPTNITRQLSINIGGSDNPGDLGTAGLHQVAIRSNGDPTKFAATNIAVQPNVGSNPPASLSGSPLTVGTTPSDVAINPATGMAVVANTGSHDITLIDLTAPSPTIIAGSICTAATGMVAPCAAPGPKGVAVAHISATNQDIAVVANSTGLTCPQATPPSCSVSIIDLKSKSVSYVLPTQDPPVSVGINPVTGRALVAMNTKNYGLLMDLTVTPPVFLGPVSISTGPNARVAVEPHLNWAIATPGGLGSLGIVDLNRQTTNNIASVSRTAGVVTVTVQPSTEPVPQSPLAVQVGDAIQIQGVSDNSFNGIYAVSSQGPGTTQFTYTEVFDSSHPDKTTFNTAGTVNYAEPIATMGLTTTVQGIGINTETQRAVLADPSPNGGVSFFSLLDQSVTQHVLTVSNGSTEHGSVAGAFNPLTNIAVTANKNTNQLSVMDPSTPGRLTTFSTGSAPVAVAIDPATNIAVVANQGDGTVSILSLGTIRPFSITETSPKSFEVDSTLSSPPAPSALTMTVLGKGFSTNSVVRLDGIPLSTSLVAGSCINTVFYPLANANQCDRKLTAIVPPALLSSARRFAVDVQNSGGAITNASDFTVTQGIDVSAGTGCTAAPLPAGVAIDAQNNIAAVSLAGCNTVALINLSTGTGRPVAVGANPLGVAVIPRLHIAIVANNASGTASIIDELGETVTNTFATGSGPTGVAADQDTGEAATADSTGNTVTVFNVATGATRTISTGQRPIAVAFNYQNHQVAMAASGGNSVAIADAGLGTISAAFSVSLPTSLLYDPWPGDCGTSNLVGCYLVDSSTGNALDILDPTTSGQSSFRIGINPTAIAYNPLTSTLISTNTGSHTVTVVDFLDRRIRAVLTLPPAPLNSTVALTGALQFAVDIHPLTNLAVIADTARGRVLFVPVPR